MEKWHDAETITFWLIIVCLLLLLLVFAVVGVSYLGFKRIVQAERNEANMQLEHQRKLLETSILVQEKERTRIAADLHDALIGKLISTQLKQQLNRDPIEISQLLKESIEEARRISHDLSPPMIEEKTLSELIQTVVTAWKKTLSVTFHRDVRLPDSLPVMVKIQLLRIVQELDTNAYKYAEAENVLIHLRYTPTSLFLRVADNGKGFDIKKHEKGLGMYNIELRMQQLGGRYRVKSAENKGVSALFTVPHIPVEKPQTTFFEEDIPAFPA